MSKKPTYDELKRRVQESEQAELKRKQTETELAQLFSMSLDMICIADINSATFIKVNPAFTEILGHSEEALLGTPFLDFVHSDDIDATRTVIEEKLQSGAKVINFENRYRCKDGSYRWLSWVSHPNIEQGVTYAVARDITEKKQYEKVVHENQRVLEATSRMAKVGGWELDLKTQKVIWTRMTGKIHELPDEYFPSLEEAINFYHPDDRKMVTDYVNQAVEEGIPYEFEARLITHKGKQRWVRAIGEPKMEGAQCVRLSGTFQDITERKAAEEALKESEILFSTIFKKNPAAIALTRMDNGCLENVNKAWQDITGYSSNEAIGQPSIELNLWVKSEQRDHLIEMVKRQGSGRGEIEIRDRYGEIHDLLFSAEIVEVMGQEYLLSMAQDITARKQAEKELKDLNEVMDLAQKMAGIGFWNYGKEEEKEQRRWSAKMFDIFGLDPQRGIPTNKDLKSIFQHEDWKRYEKAFREALEGTPYEMIVKINKDETTHFVHTQGYPRYDSKGHIIGVFGTSQDITQQILAEKALRESEEKYRNIFENAVEGFYRSAPGGRFIEVNPAFAKMLGYESPEQVISTISDIATEYYVDSKDRRKFQEKLQRSGAVDDMEFKVLRKDGSTIWVSNSTRAYFDDDGNVSHYEGIINDITERKKAEFEKERLQSQLNQAMKMEAIGNLAGGIAHDFNNILAAVIGFTEVALDEIDRGAKPQDSLQEVLNAGKRAKDLVRQILLFSRQSSEEVKPIQPDVIATEVLKFLRSSIPTTIKIEQEIESDALIMGNPTQVHQMFMNLCTNAAQAMEEKGGELSVRLRNVAIDDTSAASKLGLKVGKYIEISVADTGPGIPASIMGSIFDPYFSTKGPGEGTGIGLSVVKGIVENYGGKIGVDSRLGHGSTFTIYLPIYKEKRAAFQNTDAEKLPRGSEQILFIDDEIAIAKLGKQLLESLGYSVTTRTSSVEALELFRAKPDEFDIVLTDMTMPNMTGDKLAVELMKIRSDVPIVLCTGYSRKLSDDIAAEIGISAFAYKPIEKSDLAKIVRKALDEAKNKT